MFVGRKIYHRIDSINELALVIKLRAIKIKNRFYSTQSMVWIMTFHQYIDLIGTENNGKIFDYFRFHPKLLSKATFSQS